MRRISAADWESAARLPERSWHPDPPCPPERQERERLQFKLFFKGKEFRKSGQQWPATFCAKTSPGAKWIAVLSYDGRAPDWSRAGQTFGGDPPEPKYARFYVEIYHVASGEKAISITGSTGSYTPRDASGSVYWVGDDYFFVPTGGMEKGPQNLLVCALPAEPPGKEGTR